MPWRPAACHEQKRRSNKRSTWVERERQREELLAAIDEAEASVTSGNVRTIEKGAAQKLADEIHKRGMARMKAKKAKAS